MGMGMGEFVDGGRGDEEMRGWGDGGMGGWGDGEMGRWGGVTMVITCIIKNLLLIISRPRAISWCPCCAASS